MTQYSLNTALWMRHHAQNIPPRIADARDVVERAIRACLRRHLAVCRTISKHHLRIRLKAGERHGVGIVVSIRMRDGNFQDLAWCIQTRKRRGCILDPDIDIFADKMQRTIAQHRARQQPCFQ